MLTLSMKEELKVLKAYLQHETRTEGTEGYF